MEAPRFLKLTDVCEVLNIKMPQAYALVNSGDLPAIQVGGRNQWRVEAKELEAYIARMYAETRERIEREPPPPPAQPDPEQPAATGPDTATDDEG